MAGGDAACHHSPFVHHRRAVIPSAARNLNPSRCPRHSERSEEPRYLSQNSFSDPEGIIFIGYHFFIAILLVRSDNSQVG